MTVTVKIPTQLRSLTDGNGEVEAQGATIGELIRALEGNHPGLGARLLDDTGQLRRFLNLYVDDEDVRFLDGLETPLSESATVTIIPAVAGG